MTDASDHGEFFDGRAEQHDDGRVAVVLADAQTLADAEDANECGEGTGSVRSFPSKSLMSPAASTAG